MDFCTNFNLTDIFQIKNECIFIINNKTILIKMRGLQIIVFPQHLFFTAYNVIVYISKVQNPVNLCVFPPRSDRSRHLYSLVVSFLTITCRYQKKGLVRVNEAVACLHFLFTFPGEKSTKLCLLYHNPRFFIGSVRISAYEMSGNYK